MAKENSATTSTSLKKIVKNKWAKNSCRSTISKRHNRKGYEIGRQENFCQARSRHLEIWLKVIP